MSDEPEGRTEDSLALLRRQVLRKTLEEVDNDETAYPCVICLENVSEKATAMPCRHGNFDFLCLASWVQEKPECPLCKALILTIQYGQDDSKAYEFGPDVSSSSKLSPDGSVLGHPRTNPLESSTESTLAYAAGSTQTATQRSGRNRLPNDSANVSERPRCNFRPEVMTNYPSRRPFSRKRRRENSPPPSESDVLARRKQIYESNLFSMHVGSNRLSGYRDLTPIRFREDPHLITRAKKWIRRELEVFDFLTIRDTPIPAPVPQTGSITSSQARRATANAEFLLEWIISILKTVDIKGSKGQAQEMLKDFLGEKSPLFLHELQAWLRSPFEELHLWDANVRYDRAVSVGNSSELKISSGPDSSNQNRGYQKRRRVDRWIPD